MAINLLFFVAVTSRDAINRSQCASSRPSRSRDEAMSLCALSSSASDLLNMARSFSISASRRNSRAAPQCCTLRREMRSRPASRLLLDGAAELLLLVDGGGAPAGRLFLGLGCARDDSLRLLHGLLGL